MEFNPAMADEIAATCLLTRTRRISRVVTNIFENELRPFGINAPQFSMLVMIARLGNASRAEIGRENHQERSTSTRNLQLILSQGWAEEVPHEASGRRRPIRISQAGKDILGAAMPAWRTAQYKTRKLFGESGASAIADLAATLPTDH
ncbi:MarR family transcriptional regulator [Ochrobactrum sp. MYb29]|nr:MarR family transcriptional regulator [Ochrobactrum sp. MYb29]